MNKTVYDIVLIRLIVIVWINVDCINRSCNNSIEWNKLEEMMIMESHVSHNLQMEHTQFEVPSVYQLQIL